MLSFAWGLAVFLIVQSAMYAWNGHSLADDAAPLARLLGIFVAAALYLVAVYHLTNLYFARQGAFEAFILRDGGIFPLLFWAVYVWPVRCCPCTVFSPGAGRPARGAGGIGAGRARRLRLFVGVNHRWPGVPLDIFPGRLAEQHLCDGAVARPNRAGPKCSSASAGRRGRVLTLVGARLLNVLPRDDSVPVPAPKAN